MDISLRATMSNQVGSSVFSPTTANGTISGSTPNQSVNLDISVNVAQELASLREENKRANTKNERLKQVYQKMVQEFRDATYELSGCVVPDDAVGR